MHRLNQLKLDLRLHGEDSASNLHARAGEETFLVDISHLDGMTDIHYGDTFAYVIFDDIYGNRLFQSKNVQLNTNALWNDVFSYSARGIVDLVVTVWIKNINGGNRMYGRSKLILDPEQFKTIDSKVFSLTQIICSTSHELPFPIHLCLCCQSYLVIYIG